MELTTEQILQGFYFLVMNERLEILKTPVVHFLTDVVKERQLPESLMILLYIRSFISL